MDNCPRACKNAHSRFRTNLVHNACESSRPFVSALACVAKPFCANCISSTRLRSKLISVARWTQDKALSRTRAEDNTAEFRLARMKSPRQATRKPQSLTGFRHPGADAIRTQGGAHRISMVRRCSSRRLVNHLLQERKNSFHPGTRWPLENRSRTKAGGTLQTAGQKTPDRRLSFFPNLPTGVVSGRNVEVAGLKSMSESPCDTRNRPTTPAVSVASNNAWKRKQYVAPAKNCACSSHDVLSEGRTFRCRHRGEFRFCRGHHPPHPARRSVDRIGQKAEQIVLFIRSADGSSASSGCARGPPH